MKDLHKQNCKNGLTVMLQGCEYRDWGLISSSD